MFKMLVDKSGRASGPLTVADWVHSSLGRGVGFKRGALSDLGLVLGHLQVGWAATRFHRCFVCPSRVFAAIHSAVYLFKRARGELPPAVPATYRVPDPIPLRRSRAGVFAR
jgi:hypothetical protein